MVKYESLHNPGRQLTMNKIIRSGSGIFRRLVFVLVGGLLLAGLALAQAARAAEPAGATKLPLLVWDINFNNEPLDGPPQPLSKEQIEEQERLSEWQRLPIRTYSKIEFLTATRVATVVKEAAD